MSKEKRFLITTSDEATWKLDCPIIFLAKWCCKYDRHHIWKNLNFKVSKPYGLELHERYNDFAELLTLEKKLFPKFCRLLNQYHSTNYSIRFWQITTGHWFRLLFTQLIFRVKALKQCLQEYDISSTISYTSDKYSLTPIFFSEIIDDRLLVPWKENILNNKILNLLPEANFPIEYIKIQQNNKYNYNQNLEVGTSSYKKKIFKNIIKYYQILSKKFINNNDAFIINTYLPIKEEIKLELAFGQLPQLWKYEDRVNSYLLFKSLKIDTNSRDELTKKFENRSENYLENIFTKLLFELIPIIYLEGFNEHTKIVKKLSWPKSPKFIFTSNEFIDNDNFKLWSALKVEQGTKYFIGQHGNNYGSKINTSPRIEEVVPDKFITWGWTNQSRNVVPGFIFKNEKKKYTFNPKGGLLLVEATLTKHSTTYDERFEYVQYLENQLKFVSCLGNKLKEKLTIRLAPRYLISRWAVHQRWNDFDPNIKLENGIAKITKLFSQNRLTIFSYDSTGMLETLSRNIPTLGFWSDDYNHLLDEAKPFYKILADVGIIHFSAESAAKKIDEIWDNIDEWWSRSDVQEARKIFCAQYAKNSNNPAFELKKILLS